MVFPFAAGRLGNSCGRVGRPRQGPRWSTQQHALAQYSMVSSGRPALASASPRTWWSLEVRSVILCHEPAILAGAAATPVRSAAGTTAMNFSQRLTFLFSAPMFDADDLEGLRVSQIIAAIERLGLSGDQGAPRRGRRDRGADRRRDRLHGRRLGQEGHRGQGRLAHQPHAQARPRHADRRPRQAQALRGHSGRGARLHRRLRVPGRGDAGIHRPEPRLAPQAICRHAEDAVLRRARRLPGRGQSAVDLPGPQRRRLLQPQPDRPHLRRASGRGGLSRRSRQFDPRARRPSDPRRAGAAGAERGRRDLRRREDLFRPQRHLVVEQDRADQPDRRGRPGAVRPQQPQGRASGRAA